MHVGLLYLHEIEPRGGVHHHGPRACGLAYDLLVNLAFGGHVDDDIALHRRLTAKSPPVEKPALVLVALLDAVPFRQGRGFRDDPEFGKLAVGGRDLAF